MSDADILAEVAEDEGDDDDNDDDLNDNKMI